MKYVGDISPAIRELKKLHIALLKHIVESASSPSTRSLPVNARILNDTNNTVISIVPGGRRKELGWYKARKWEKKSDEMLREIDPTHKVPKYHEIFIAGEALQGNAKDLVLLMMHQVAHQAAGVQSIQSYHGEWLPWWLHNLFNIPMDAVERKPVMGWVTLDPAKLGPAKELVDKLAKRVKVENIDLFRDNTVQNTAHTGKMYKWTCECGKPVVRTGGVLLATCERCHETFKVQVTQHMRATWVSKVPADRRR